MAKDKTDAGGGTGAGITLCAGNRRRLQSRKERKDGFDAAKRQVFLDHLAACCNVRLAAAAAGAGVTTAYEARRRDPLFAAQWDEAIQTGYVTLEALLIERAALGAARTGGAYQPGETPVPGPETIDVALAVDLLRISRRPRVPRRPVGPPVGRAAEKAVNDSLLAKLDVLARRKRREREKKKALRHARDERKT